MILEVLEMIFDFWLVIMFIVFFLIFVTFLILTIIEIILYKLESE